MLRTNEIAEVILSMMFERSYKMYLTNTCISGMFEADVLGINGNDYLIEFEIKRSRADFHADFKKELKHTWLKERESHENKYASKGEIYFRIPNRFYYVCEEGLIQEDEIPEYAGLIYIEPQKAKSKFRSSQILSITEVKRAPLLHKQKATSQIYEQIAHILACRTVVGSSYGNYVVNKSMKRTKFK